MSTSYQLQTCYHPVLHPDKRGGQLPVQHCYAELVTASGQTIDSISYDGPSGVSEQATAPTYRSADHRAHCEIVRDISSTQWQHLKQQLHQTCRADNFSVAHNNCCSCLGQVLATEFGVQPDNIRQAQIQIAQQRPYAIIKS